MSALSRQSAVTFENAHSSHVGYYSLGATHCHRRQGRGADDTVSYAPLHVHPPDTTPCSDDLTLPRSSETSPRAPLPRAAHGVQSGWPQYNRRSKRVIHRARRALRARKLTDRRSRLT
jgi:hypothetical protein